MLVPQSPLVRLHQHARGQEDSPALIEQHGDSWISLTWPQLYRRVIDGAAGMLTAGVRPGQVVVILLPAGARLVELELATRAMGGIPLLLPERMDPHEVGLLLRGADVGLVVVDQESRLEILRHAALDHAQLFECDDTSWDRLREIGAEDRTQRPGVLAQADAARDHAGSRTVLGLPREKSSAWLFRPQSSGATSDLKADDVVLLVGAPAERFTTVVRDAHQAVGCRLAWVERPDQLEAALTQVRPTHVLLERVCANALEDLLVDARVDGQPWHVTPREVLDAAAAVAARARLNSRGRRLAAEVKRLEPWWGGRLRQLVLDTRVNRTVIGLSEGLGFQVGRIAHEPAVKIELPILARVPRRRLAPPAPPAPSEAAPAPAPVPAAAPAPSPSPAPAIPAAGPPAGPSGSPTLPRRARTSVDSAFTPAGLPGS